MAEALQRELRRFGVPWYRHRPAPPGARCHDGGGLGVFLDASNMSLAPGLWPSSRAGAVRLVRLELDGYRDFDWSAAP